MTNSDERAQLAVPPHTRLILASEDLLEQWGARTEDGYRIRAEWGEQKPEGWYEPTFTVDHTDRFAATPADATGPDLHGFARLRRLIEEELAVVDKLDGFDSGAVAAYNYVLSEWPQVGPAGQEAGLDVERLARAIADIDTGLYWMNEPRAIHDPPNMNRMTFNHTAYAEQIAAEYARLRASAVPAEEERRG